MYQPSTGTPQTTTFTYDGLLNTRMASTGLAGGTFAYAFTNDFFLSAINFTSSTDAVPRLVANDADGLVSYMGHFPSRFLVPSAPPHRSAILP